MQSLSGILNRKSAGFGQWGDVKVLFPLQQVADSYPLMSNCYRRTVAFCSGHNLVLLA